MVYSSKSYTLATLLGLTLLIASCLSESPASIEMLASQKQLVLNGHLSPDAPLMVSVTNNIPFTSTTLALRNIPDARVELWENGQKVEEGLFVPSGSFGTGGSDIEKMYPEYFKYRAFYSFNSVPKTGKSYTVRVNAPGYPSLEAVDLVPENAVNAVRVQPLTLDRAANQLGVAVDFELVELDSYFHLLFFIREKGKPVEEQVQVNLNGEGVVDADANGVGFSGGINSGILYSPEVFSAPSNTRLLVLQDPKFGLTGFEYEIRAELRTVSKSYYEYYVSVIQQKEKLNDRFSTPTLIFNNVQGGLGNLSAYTARKSGWVEVK